MMKNKEKLYQATRGSSLFDYCLFNKKNKKSEKNEFLSLLSQSLTQSKWFDISKFSTLGSKPFNKGFTQVPFADKQVQEEEFNTLVKIFTEQEILELIRIINNLQSYGVIAIKELMDNEKEFNNPTISMRSAFIKLFKFKK